MGGDQELEPGMLLVDMDHLQGEQGEEEGEQEGGQVEQGRVSSC